MGKRIVYLHKLWRDAVISQRGTRCESCGETEATTVIEAHHIASVNDYPALAYMVENGAVICCRCHAHLHSGRADLAYKVNSAIVDADTARAQWIADHLDDPVPDYEDKDVIAAIRAYLQRNILGERNAYSKRYYIEHKAEFAAKGKAYREAHKAEVAAYNKAYHAKRQAAIVEARRAYAEEHADEIRAQYEAHKALQKAKKKAGDLAYRKRNAERIREKNRIYRETHREQIRAYFAEHQAEFNAKERERRRKKRLAKQTAALPVEEPT